MKPTEKQVEVFNSLMNLLQEAKVTIKEDLQRKKQIDHIENYKSITKGFSLKKEVDNKLNDKTQTYEDRAKSAELRIEKSITELKRQIKDEDFDDDVIPRIQSDELTTLRAEQKELVKKRNELKYSTLTYEQKTKRQERIELERLHRRIANINAKIENERRSIFFAKTKSSKIKAKKKLKELKEKLKEVQDSNGTSKTLIGNFKSIIKNKIFSFKKRTEKKEVKLEMKQKRKFDLKKVGIWDIVFLLVVIWFSVTAYKDITIKEYNLITNKKIVTIGKIIEIEESSDYVESDSGGGGMRYEYSYAYIFNVKGKEIKVFGGTVGNPPFNMDLEDVPYEVEVEYLSKNPNKFNRIKGLDNDVTSLSRWFTRRILLRVIAILFVIFIIYKKQTDIDFFK